jgi:hypothetical protein
MSWALAIGIDNYPAMSLSITIGLWISQAGSAVSGKKSLRPAIRRGALSFPGGRH